MKKKKCQSHIFLFNLIFLYHILNLLLLLTSLSPQDRTVIYHGPELRALLPPAVPISLFCAIYDGHGGPRYVIDYFRNLFISNQFIISARLSFLPWSYIHSSSKNQQNQNLRTTNRSKRYFRTFSSPWMRSILILRRHHVSILHIAKVTLYSNYFFSFSYFSVYFLTVIEISCAFYSFHSCSMARWKLRVGGCHL